MGSRGRKSAAELAVIRPALDRLTSTRELSPPPEHLQPETKAWWTSITTDYELEQYQLHTLQAAGEAWDLYQLARAELAKHGLTFADDKGMI